MLILMLPIAVYAVVENEHRDWLIGAAVVMSVIVVLENAFLTYYIFNGKGFNLVYLNMLAPKLFFNVRDGNFLALVQFESSSPGCSVVCRVVGRMESTYGPLVQRVLSSLL